MTETAGRVTVGDLIQQAHPAFAAVVTALLVGGAAVSLLGAVAAIVSHGSKPAIRVAWSGLGVVFVCALVLIAAVFAVVFPGIGVGILCLVAVGAGYGYYLRTHRRV